MMIQLVLLLYVLNRILLFLLNNINTPLHEAAEFGHVSIAVYLHDNGANIEAINKVVFV